MKTKKLLLFLQIGTILTLTSCMSFKDAGRLNMVSCRNIDTHAKYQLLKKNTEYTKKELRHIRTTTLESAIDEVVKKVDGGEYLMNAKIKVCIISGYGQSTVYYAVEGDVWGIKSLKIGDL